MRRSSPGPRPSASRESKDQTFGEAWEERSQLDDEVPGHQQHAERKDNIARQPHPLPEERCVIERADSCVGEPMLVDRVQLRPADWEEVEDDPQDQAAVVEPKGPPPELRSERLPTSGCQSALTFDSGSARKKDPDGYRFRLVPVANRRVPRASLVPLRATQRRAWVVPVCPPG
jgi:hypothetical protein